MKDSIRNIAIIGGGITGVAAYISLICYNIAENIYIIAPTSIGESEAFDSAEPDMICNTSAGSISVVPENLHDFTSFLNDRGMQIEPKDFVPRRLVSEYVKTRFKEYSKNAEANGVKTIYIRRHATRIELISNERKYCIYSAGENIITADAVIVCTGYSRSIIPEFAKEFANHQGIFTSPYPVKNITTLVSPESQVLIIGTKLSAIETAITLAEENHRVTMASPSGELPAVRTHTLPAEAELIDIDEVAKLDFKSNKLPQSITKVVIKAISKLTDLPLSLQISKKSNPIERLEEEVQLARKGNIYWQDIMVELIDIINELMAGKDSITQQKALHSCNNIISRYMGACSLENAKKLLEALKAEKIHLHQGVPVIVNLNYNAQWEVEWGNEKCQYETIIFATGREYPKYSLSNSSLDLNTVTLEPMAEPYLDKNFRVYHSRKQVFENIWLLGISSHSSIPLVNAIYPAIQQAKSLGKWLKDNIKN
ncbi:FAD/NAD(P)-binding protein [Photorhabdus kleinii]|uniref:FAD/NAD(P)-binding protein n=1 Tax=Photorhabdus kleinii TaxID=768034 RepID=UPI0021D4CAEF|nr:FAD/NAD(P)-binding protein [Photorhabdus kleinii]MCT8343904.1 FAD/NAD(P)-binding protein [Photorhabdus kleinii]